MSAIVPHARLRADLDLLSDLVSSLDFGLATPAQHDRRARRDHLVGIVRRYLEPRLADPGHPLVVAVFGPTGSGKSTIVNTLAGRELSPTGVIRPTTDHPVAWAHARHVDAVRAMLGSEVEVVADEHPVLGALALVDTPDIDSVASTHRRQTMRILEAADVAVAVTTPQRYADAVPWDVLGDLTERALRVEVVVNRATRRTGAAVIDLAALLRDARVEGIASADDIVVIQEQRIRGDGRLHGFALRGLARRLQDLARQRSTASTRGIREAARHCVRMADELADQIVTQQREADRLRSVVVDVAGVTRSELAARIDDGDLIRGEVVARWRRIAGMSDLADVVTRTLDRLRRGDPPGIVQVQHELVDELTESAYQRVLRAVTSVQIGWATTPAGEELAAMAHSDPGDVRTGLHQAVSDWQSRLVEVVADAAGTRGRLSRATSYGINGVATLVLLGMFTATGGLTGAEVGVAAGAAAAQQALLERVLGSTEIRRLEKEARADLVDRLAAELDRALSEYGAVVDDACDDLAMADELREAAARVAAALEEWDGE